MKTFTLTPDCNITAYASRKTAVASGHASFSSADELDTVLLSLSIKLVDLWNSLPGLTPVKKFTDRKTGIARVWKQLQSLEATPDESEGTEQTADVAPEKAHTPRDGSKQAQVVALMKRPAGATLDEIMQATDWQRHTVRGFIAGAAKVKLGLHIESFKTDEGQRAYRVVA